MKYKTLLAIKTALDDNNVDEAKKLINEALEKYAEQVQAAAGEAVADVLVDDQEVVEEDDLEGCDDLAEDEDIDGDEDEEE